MCHAFRYGDLIAAGRYGDTRNRRKSTQPAFRSWSLRAFPGPDQSDHLPLTEVSQPEHPVSGPAAKVIAEVEESKPIVTPDELKARLRPSDIVAKAKLEALKAKLDKRLSR